jgi:glycosyltransferase involved in cell wall biosynthesis
VARRRVDATRAVSAHIAAKLTAEGFRGVENVGVLAPEPRVDRAPPRACRDVVFAGKLVSQKGVDVLLEAVAAAVGAGREAGVVIVGDGPERQRLEHLATALLPGRVRFTGRIDAAGVERELARARVVAVPSVPARKAEGMPLVAVEAAALGRPLVVSDDPGLREAVGDQGGLVVPAGSIADLAAALDRVLGDDGLADQLGRAARQRWEESYSPSTVIERVRAVYESVGAARAGAA